MKNKSLSILLLAAFLLALVTCKKELEPNIETFEITKENLTAATTSVTIVGTYDYPGVIDGIKACVSENGASYREFDVELEEQDFSVTITGLVPATEYQYHYAVDYGFEKPFITETKTFTTLNTEKPTVKALEWLKIDSTTYRIKCQVVADGGSEVTERGICWNTFGSPIPHDDNTQTYDGDAEAFEEYSVRMEHLDLGKKYYVRAWAKNAAGKTGKSEEVLDFETEAPVGTSVEINLECNPEQGGTVTGGGTYEIGTQCTAKAEPNSGYTFINWTENGNQVSSEASYTFPVTVGRSLVANFTKQAYVITAKVNPDNSGTITGAGGYNYGEECPLTATPNAGYEFVKWTKGGSTVSTQSSYTFTVTETAEYEAQFRIKSYAINVSANPENGGTVEGGGTYNYGESCTVRARNTDGFAFTNWTDDGEEVSRDADFTFTVTSNRHLKANFTELQPDEYSIQVSANPPEGGTVTGGGTYTQGASCTVNATKNTGYHFVNWTENEVQVFDLAEYPFTVEGNRVLVANFEADAPTEYTINVSANLSNGGTVTGGGTFEHGEQCRVSAEANTGYTFVNWTENGEEVSQNANYTFNVNRDRNLVANFQVQSYTISASANPTNGGTVTGAGTYNYGESCSLSATANSGYTFTKWTENGNVVSTNPNYPSFTVTSDRTLVANFQVQAPNTYNINVSANPGVGGTVTGGGSYNQGASCTVTATAAADYRFIRWEENGSQVSQNASYQFTVNGNRTLVAQFITKPTVTTSQVTNITQTTATGGGNVTNSGGATVTERGICWSTSHNPSLSNGSHQQASSGGTGSFTVNMTGLTPGTTYYVRAYATNSEGTGYGTEVYFTTQQPYTITATANPTNGGTATVSGNGSFTYGQQCTLTATPANGYSFVRWTKNGTQVSTQNPYAFNVTETASYVAHFQVNATVPTVTTSQVTNITQTTATGGGNVTSDGGATVTERGICWSTSHNPSLSNGSHQQASSGGTGSFTVNMTGLTPGTTYYVRAYATNSEGTGYGTEVSFTTQQPYIITATANPTNGGTATVSGNGSFTYGQQCTLTATPANGYSFVRWTKNGTQVSTQNPYAFNVTETASFVAHFQANATIPTVTTSQVTNITQTTATGGGNVTSDGGATVTERGICWSTSQNPSLTNGSHQQASSGGTGSFTVNMNGLTPGNLYHVRAYATNSAGTAYGADVTFTTLSNGGSVPQGAINGLFTINDNGDQVYFSNGNLQYNKTTNEWSFMEHQYDIVETAGQNVGENYANQNIISLFGWGTSGYHDIDDPYNVNYQPWSTSVDSINASYNYYGYGPSMDMPSPSLTGSSADYDWGVHNAISNGGDQAGLWRTLTYFEWVHVFNTRTGIRYAKAQITGTSNGIVNGVILFPDNWSTSTYVPNSYNEPGASYSSNPIPASQWPAFEEAGAVFLPASRIRVGTLVEQYYLAYNAGFYWSTTYYHLSNRGACYVRFNEHELDLLDGSYGRNSGQSVRLVCPAGN